MRSIAIIGIGNMGFAILNGISKIFDKENIFICESNEDKLNEAKIKFDIPSENSSSDQNLILSKADIVILAVKPQSFDDLCRDMPLACLYDKIVISIMAGISLKKLTEKLNSKKIIRSMPNLCVQVSKGLFGWIASTEVLPEEKDFVRKIFKSMGEEIELQDESKIDEITALSGSGPAYFFYLCEILEKQAREFGFSEEQARKISEMTFVGSALTLTPLAPLVREEFEKSPPDKGDLGGLGLLSAAEFRKAVTSKGGTTEAALNFLQENKFEEIFKEAIKKAKRRAEELNQ